ncbi:MAG TPA: hypothetical protein VFX24_06530 [Ktedonobacterales bacterium]|nr:hypothetical protein [Ktedonobacterales bacterium]
MNESQDSNHVPDAGVAVASTTSATERFERGTEMRALYERMRPDQRTAIAGEFIRLLTLAGDNHVEQFRQKFQERTQLTDGASDHLLSAGQVEAIDSYVRQSHPEMIAQMLQHPVTRSALEMPGVPPAEEEPDVPANKDKIMPTENVATSGAAYATSWEMMELGGEEANRLAEAPHEFGVGPGGEVEREQRLLENEGEEGLRPTEEPPERSS